MPETDPTDPLDAFKAAIAEQLRSDRPGPSPGHPGPPPGLIPISVPPDHPLAQMLKATLGGLLGGGSGPGPAGDGASGGHPSVPPAVPDFVAAVPSFPAALRHIVREGVESGEMSPKKAMGMLALAHALEDLPPDWLSATIAQVIAIRLAGGGEARCFDVATAGWFAGHADVFARVLSDVRSMAEEEGRIAAAEEEGRRRPWWSRLRAWMGRKSRPSEDRRCR